MKLAKIYCTPDGRCWHKAKNTEDFIKINTLNMSWIPLYLTRKLFKHSLKQIHSSSKNEFSPTLFSIQPTIYDNLEEKYFYYKRRIQSKFFTKPQPNNL